MMWFVALFLLAVLAFLFVWWKSKHRILSPRQRKEIDAYWKEMLSHDDPMRRIMVADAVLDRALSELGYTGSLGDKLKKMGARFSDLNAVWKAHKLRNTVAHEPDFHVTEKDAVWALRVFQKAIDDISC